MKRFYATWRDHEWVVVDRNDDTIVDCKGNEPRISRENAIHAADSLNDEKEVK